MTRQAPAPRRPPALHMLLRSERLFTLPEKQRLPALLAASRKYQNTVSTRLAGQVLAPRQEPSCCDVRERSDESIQGW